MTLSQKEIQKIANLAQIEMSDSEQLKIQQEINRILAMIAEMQKIDTANVEAVSHPLGGQQRLREDKITSNDTRKSVLSNAPSEEENLFMVPKVIE
ncbi:MAG: Asp-tRNA(Asn)/Glu-tRNA(Gln) amidotransferase GatCAB subunit C [Proteobacteria bacterium]|nr:Asp-tRNA(Asn)/Glu-tRNA(Gln) amidotransferase GatCAB subunit C [Pseudomonadota bacterium]|tara:strand:+ start:590 stop:877 length:288 start_codon:yes stop_codon:yes gene_type:complete